MTRHLIAAVALLALLTGCAAVGPNFRKPDEVAPAAFKYAPEQGTTLGATSPAPAIESWWWVFNDSRLNELQSAALGRSPQITSALSRVSQARASLGVAHADRQPKVSVNASAIPAGRSAAQTLQLNGQNVTFRAASESYVLPVDVGYEVDFWGRVRRSVESADASLKATEADQRGVWLTLTSDIAQYYFSLEALDIEIKIVSDTAQNLRVDAEINASRFRSGLANELDVERANVEAANVASDLSDLRRRRAQTANALAFVVGLAPSEFAALSDSSPLPLPPVIPPGLPSSLLTRRPDLAKSEAELHARTADIGIAEANRLPTITLTGSAGFSSQELVQALNQTSQFWNIGAGLVAPLFDAGRLRSLVDLAKSRADEARANYREVVLEAFREVDDALVAMREQDAQSAAQTEARTAAKATTRIAHIRYEKGLANYLDVTDAERSLLQIQRTEAQLIGARYASTVTLIKALGGTWQQ